VGQIGKFHHAIRIEFLGLYLNCVFVAITARAHAIASWARSNYKLMSLIYLFSHLTRGDREQERKMLFAAPSKHVRADCYQIIMLCMLHSLNLAGNFEFMLHVSPLYFTLK